MYVFSRVQPATAATNMICSHKHDQIWCGPLFVRNAYPDLKELPPWKECLGLLWLIPSIFWPGMLPLTKNPEGCQILDVDPKVLPFGAKASPVINPTTTKRPRCMMMHHGGTYAAVCQPDVPRETSLTQLVSHQTHQPLES